MAINFPNSPTNNQIFIDQTSQSQFRYNSVYGVWNRLTGTAYSNTVSNYYVANGTANSFTLSNSVYNQNNIIVTIDGLVQVPSAQYNISGSTITFYAPPTQYSIVEVRNFEPGLWGGGVGYTGSRGSLGYTGSIGYSGSIGYTGSSGAGYVGSQGATGSSSLPVNTQSTSYVLANSDLGTVLLTSANVTVNSGIVSAGFNCTIFNNSSANITIIANTGTTMYWAGTANTGNRTLLQRGLATIICIQSSNTFTISGNIL